MPQKRFRTDAHSPQCVETIGRCLNKVLRPSEWNIDLESDEKTLTVSSPKPEGLIVQLMREAGYSAVPI